MAPHLCEELWLSLGDGIAAEADWPEPREDVTGYERERDLIETTRADARDITGTTGTDPEEITLAVAPDWKYGALSDALDAEGEAFDAAATEERVAEYGDAVTEYAGWLAANRQSLREPLAPEREYEALRRASWLFEKEFDARVRVLRAEEAPADLRDVARPEKPGIAVT